MIYTVTMTNDSLVGNATLACSFLFLGRRGGEVVICFWILLRWSIWGIHANGSSYGIEMAGFEP